MRGILLAHVIAGGLGLISGYVALYAAKGATLHRKAGILFVSVMVTMAITGMLDMAGLLMALGTGLACFILAIGAITRGGREAGMAYPLFLFGGTGLAAAVG